MTSPFRLVCAAVMLVLLAQPGAKLNSCADEKKETVQIAIRLFDRENAFAPGVIPNDLTVQPSGLVTTRPTPKTVDDDLLKKMLDEGLRDGQSYTTHICLHFAGDSDVSVETLGKVLARMQSLKAPNAKVDVVLVFQPGKSKKGEAPDKEK